ncbi:hypothetical protein Micbo1qcDRAFT_167474 [Microdochium bolleyi]|uniref:FAD-binding PCMH-type domain-containing protein n=1 Tax=Microdochium bolleyi TaxID=196109 RepID=A0A136IRM0_9PEZI|nr:hypothetical protein Micbo1qcDRAFT_167474 [Microdochium bolleyi]
MSFYSGHHGLMCSNVAAYTVVLADGSITTASAAENPDLWRALKGGVNNFGVVAEFRLRVYPGGPVWQRVTITPSFLTGSVVRAYYEHGIQAARADKFDPNVSTPIMSFAYMPDLGMAFWCTQLFYTVRPPSSVSSDSALPGQQDDNSDSGPRKIGDKTWPAYWKASPLGRLWGIPMRRSTATTHAQAVRHVGDMSALEMRNSYVVTGFRLDLPTMHAAVDVFHRAKARLSALTPGGTAFCMVFQTLNPRWMNKGDPNVLGLEGEEEPLVVLEFCCNWADARHDKLVEEVFREAIAEVEKASAELGSAHRYRFTNYASEWQRPLEGYGEENLQFMREVSRRYDPKGLFQTGCLGGFKLGREDL